MKIIEQYFYVILVAVLYKVVRDLNPSVCTAKRKLSAITFKQC